MCIQHNFSEVHPSCRVCQLMPLHRFYACGRAILCIPSPWRGIWGTRVWGCHHKAAVSARAQHQQGGQSSISVLTLRSRLSPGSWSQGCDASVGSPPVLFRAEPGRTQGRSLGHAASGARCRRPMSVPRGWPPSRLRCLSLFHVGIQMCSPSNALLQTTFGCRYGYTKNHFFSVTSDGSHKTSVSDASFPVKERATCAPAPKGAAWPACTRGAGAPDGDSG